MQAHPTTKAKFGFKQIAKHPPKWLVPAVTISVALLTLLQMLVKSDPILSVQTKDIIDYYADALILAITFLAPLFGVDIKRK